MNEKRIAKIDEQTKIIEGLNSQVKQLSDASKEQCEKIKKLREELVVANASLEYYKELPWFKRIFFKGRIPAIKIAIEERSRLVLTDFAASFQFNTLSKNL